MSNLLQNHTILQLRIGRTNEQSPEAMVQVLAALPKIQDALTHRLLPMLTGELETMSLEIWSLRQLVSFQIYLPARLVDYATGLLGAAYPKVLVTEQSEDVAQIISQQPECLASFARMKNPAYLPFMTYSDFSETNSLAPLLSTLSQLAVDEQAMIQWVISPQNERWKAGAARRFAGVESHPLSAQVEHKLKSEGITTWLRVAVGCGERARARSLLHHIETACQSWNQSEGNHLQFLRAPFLQPKLRRQLMQRSQANWPKIRLSIHELATFYHLPGKSVVNIPNIAWGTSLPGEPPEALPVVRAGMDKADRIDINPFARTYFKNDDVVYGIRRADRRRHMYVIGKTGTGKSTLLANMAINDLKNDEGMCVIDPHGDLVETLLDYIPSRRINDVIYFDPSDPDHTVQINLFEGENVVHRELIASGLVSVFHKLYAYSWGPRLEYILRNALLTLLHSEQARLSDVIELLTNRKFREKIVQSLDDPILRSYWENEFAKMHDRLQTEAIAPILNKVGQFVSSPLVRNVVNARKSSFSIEKSMNEGKIILANLSQGKLGEDNATLLGAMLITKIQLAAMSRVYVEEADRRDFFLYVDEFQNFATDSFTKILSEARKYRLNLTLANQYIAQIPEEVQKGIFGNCGSIISFVMGADDADSFVKEYGGLYSADDLVQLGRHQIINKLSIDNIISQPFPAVTLPLAASKNQSRQKVIQVSRERYAKKK